jgi:hypothetical protein
MLTKKVKITKKMKISITWTISHHHPENDRKNFCEHQSHLPSFNRTGGKQLEIFVKALLS